MPGSCEADKTSPSSLVSSLRSYRLKSRPKCSASQQSLSSGASSSGSDNTISQAAHSSNNCNEVVSNNCIELSQQSHSNHLLNTNSTSASLSSNVAQNNSSLSYKKYQILHTNQFVLPCILTKARVAIKKDKFSVSDISINLTEEEYVELKELVSRDVLLAKLWNNKIKESTNYVIPNTKELRINRDYLNNICKELRRYISNPNSTLDTSTSSAPSQNISQSSSVKLVRTYSRTPKIPSTSVNFVKPVDKSVSISVNNKTVNLQSSKNIMNEYEVFCEKEQNLRKLLDLFPGADIMEAQDILVKCNWNLEEAVKIAHSQPLRCIRKKAVSASSGSSTETMNIQQPMNVNNSELNNSVPSSALKVAEEIVLDSSDEEYSNTIKPKTIGDKPAAKRARKMLSSSESEEDNSFKSNQVHTFVKRTNSSTNSLSQQNSISNANNIKVEKIYSTSQSLTIKPVQNALNSIENSEPVSLNSMPNIPKGLVITPLNSSSTPKTICNEPSINNKSTSSINMTNLKAEVISVSSHNQPDSSTSKPAQLVRIKVNNGNSSSSSSPVMEYSIHPTGSVVSSSKSATTLEKFSKSAFSMSRQEKVVSKARPTKGKRKKYTLSDDDDADYGNEDIYDSDDSDIEENLTAAHSAVLKFFQEATQEELGSIPGCSKKKVEAIANIRPFSSWVDLVQKISNDKMLSTDLLNGAKKVLDMRNAINKLMAKCQQISLDMEDLVESLKENRESSSDYVTKQPDLLNDKMHLAPYQMLGLNWLLLLHNQEVNGILADEMGLGKTVQAVSFLAYLKQISISGPHLIVVPSSTMDNWKQELQTWWPSVSLLIYHGSQESRRELRFKILNDEVEEFDVMVTTYNMVTSSAEDRGFFKRLEFQYVIFDEAHMLKNMASQRYQHLMRIRAPRRLLLTGTPLQNNLVELMSLLIFAMPDMFSGKTEQIKQMFSTVTKSDGSKSSYEKDRIEHAKRIMKPFVLRRLKKEVLQDLPVKHDEVRFCPMLEDQAKKYKALVEKFSAEMTKNKEDGAETIKSSGVGIMMQLRRAANHPLLLRKFYDDDTLLKMSTDILKEPTHTESNPDLVFEDMSVMSDFELYRLCKNFDSLKPYILPKEKVLESGKFKVLDELLPLFISEGNRILLFSQFTMVLDIIEEYMYIKGYKFMRLDGQTPVSERQGMIDKFNNDSTISLFLLSTKAGGLGINLTAANVVILHDIDFNPYNDKQAEDRCHRVGQTKDVRVIRFISEQTIEEGILQCAKEKLKLERDIHEENEDDENDSASVAKLLRDALRLKNPSS